MRRGRAGADAAGAEERSALFESGIRKKVVRGNGSHVPERPRGPRGPRASERDGRPTERPTHGAPGGA